MHLLDTGRGYYGGWGIVGGHLPLATGLALALVRQDKPQAVLCELGEGAVNMGAWHESLNLAALWKLPVLFVVVNNKYGMGTAVDRASAETDQYKRASAFRMHGEAVDGDDLEAVLDACGRLLARAREEREPAVLEAVTYRYRGHSVADAGLAYRTKDEIAEHKEGDPIRRVASRLRESGSSDEDLDAIDERVKERVREAVEFAKESPEPPRRPARLGDARAGVRRAVRPHAAGQRVRRGGADVRRGAGQVSAAEKTERRPAVRHQAHDLPRGAAARAPRGAAARRARVHHGRGGRRLRGLLQGHGRPDGRVRRGPRARHADLRGGLRRRRDRGGDARRAPDRGDHDAQLPAGRDGPGGQPRGQDRRDVRRRGPLPAGHPHAERGRQPADRTALAIVRRLVRGDARAEGRRPGQPGGRQGPAQGRDPRRGSRCW